MSRQKAPKLLKQTRFVSANTKMKFTSSADYFREMGERVRGWCECDGAGCSVCIASDALLEAANLVTLLSKNTPG